MIAAELSRRVAKARQSEVFLKDLSFDHYLSILNTLSKSDAQTFDALPNDIQELIERAESSALTASAAFHLEGKHDQDSHGRDKPDKPKTSGFKVGKKLKITQAFVHKNRPIGTTVAISSDGRSKVVFTGGTGILNGVAMGPYTHFYRKSVDSEWEEGARFSKAKAHQWFKDESDIGTVWHEPADESDDDNDDDELVGELIDEPVVAKPEAAKPKAAKVAKSAGSPGSPLKITHGLVHKAHGESGTILTENGAGDKRVVWDGAEYRLQRKTDSGSWTTEKKVKKSKAYVEVNAYDSDWRVPADSESSDNTEPVSTATAPPTPDVTDVGVSNPATSNAASTDTASINDYPLMDPTLVKQSSFKKGGVFKDKYGGLHNIQPAQSESHAHNELLASKLYAYAAIGVEHVELVQTDPSKLQSPSGIGVKTNHKPSEVGLTEAMKTMPLTKQMVNQNFAFDAWLGNWDVVGLGYENITVAKNGVTRRSSLGGSLLYRANGQPKGAAFGDTVTEIDSLRNPHLNPPAAKVFADVTDDDIRAGVARIEKITPDDIEYLVSQAGFTGKEADALSSKLQARRADLINKYGANAPKPAAWPANAPAASTQPTATNALGGTKTYTPSQKAKVQSIFAKHNLHWYNKTDAIYNAAQEVSTTHPDLTMGDALDIMDQSLKKKTGNPFRTKVEKFLKTKAGKNHALAKGGSASLGGTAPKTPPTATPSPSSTAAPKNKYVDHGGALPQKLTRITAGILQQRMNQASPPPWTTAQKAALRKYTGGDYSTINRCARGVAPCTSAVKQNLKDINAAMKPSTDDVVVFRKTSPKSFGVESGKDLEAMIGKTISDNGVISTSIRDNMWQGSLDIEIEAPKGSMMAWVQPISYHPGEDEIIVAPGTHYEIIEVVPPHDASFGSYKIKLRIIPGSDAQSRAQAEKLKTQQAIAALKAKQGAK